MQIRPALYRPRADDPVLHALPGKRSMGVPAFERQIPRPEPVRGVENKILHAPGLGPEYGLAQKKHPGPAGTRSCRR